ncbi:MAG: cytochrome c [Bacteroidetes bacterium]|nr:cytochrome c [Bacteroidota bacterium]MDA1333059.1 cytochrome c [Bacteroidota bacterium]
MHTNTYFGRLLAAAMILVLTGCQGSLSEKPPLHFNQNMDFQEKFQAQESNSFFADGRAMREPVRGTVARGFLKDDVAFWTGRNENGSFTENPLTVDLALLERGKDQYEIFCSVCHGIAGDGQGIIMTGGYGYVPAPTYHSDMLRAQPDGYIYDALTWGIRSMPGYSTQVKAKDRWAIVAYIRALQRSQSAAVSDVPESER